MLKPSTTAGRRVRAIVSALAVLMLLPSVAEGGTIQASGAVALSVGTRDLLLPGIVIDGNAGFLLPGSGVVGGNGTPADPYRIEGWTVLHRDVAAVHIKNTSASVVISDLYIPGDDGFPFAAIACNLPAPPFPICRGSIGVHLENASHVRLQRIRALHDNTGVAITDGSSDVVLDRIDLRSTIHARLEAPTPSMGIAVDSSSNVTISNATITDRSFSALVFRSQDVMIRDSTISAPPASLAIRITDSKRVGIVGNDLDGASISAFGVDRDILIAQNNIWNATHAFYKFGFGSVTGLDICGNTVLGATRANGAIFLSQMNNVVVRGNIIRGGARGIMMSNMDNVTLTSNEISGSASYGLVVGGSNVSGSGNSIFDNGAGSDFEISVNFTGNWWGDASGPSGIGPGSGDSISTYPGVSVDYSSWLTAPPSLAVDCGVPARSVAPPVVSFAEVEAGVTVHAHVHVHQNPVNFNRVIDLYLPVGTGEIVLP